MHVDVSGITKEAVKMLYFQALESMFLLVCLWGGVVNLPDHTTHAIVLYIKSHACPLKQDHKEEILM
jgi:hypothetical protein